MSFGAASILQGASSPRSWFFHLQRTALVTPTASAASCAGAFLDASAMTASRFCSSANEPALARLRRLPGSSSSTQLASNLLGFRVSELADGAGEALPAIEEVVDGGPLLEVVAAPMAPSAQVPVFRELHVPQPEGMAVGIAELVYDRRRATVASKVELDRPHLVLI